MKPRGRSGSGLQDMIPNMLANADIDMRAHEFTFKLIVASGAAGLVGGTGAGLAGAGPEMALFAACAAAGGVFFAAYVAVIYMGYQRLRMIEEVLPDFLSLMASNIRAGLTPDRAMLLSARKEFGPLAKVVDRAAKECITGAPVDEALWGMTEQIRSEMFSKSIRLVVEGIRSGGELHDLLDNTSLDMRRFAYLRKEVASTVMVYELFIFAASAFGAPLLYGVANFLLGIITTLRSKMQFDLPSGVAGSMPFQPSDTPLDAGAIFWFSILAIMTTVLFGCLASGIITKGREIDGARYFPPLVVVAYIVFFGSMGLLQLVFSKVFHF